MNSSSSKYILNFLIIFIISYLLIILLFDNILSKILTIIVGNILNINYYNNVLLAQGRYPVYVSSPCNCSFEIALFLGFVLGTPKISLKYKISYSIFGLILINIINIIRIILIINNYDNVNYWKIHDIVSFILFPVILFLNILWVHILNIKNIIK